MFRKDLSAYFSQNVPKMEITCNFLQPPCRYGMKRSCSENVINLQPEGGKAEGGFGGKCYPETSYAKV